MREPSAVALGGTAPLRIARRLFLATRPAFFTASILPVLLGSAWGYGSAGAFDASAFALALLATVFVHAATNVLNDVYDELSGNDAPNAGRIHPYTGGSRFIQNGVMTAAEMRHWGTVLLVLGVFAGAVLVYLKGTAVVGFGLIGMLLGILYSAPPIRLSARGWGEVAVGVGFGPLPVVGAAWLQTGQISLDAALLSLPVGIWIANVLLINEVPDADADAASGCRTVAVRLGAAGTRRLYLAGQAIAAASAVGLSLAGLLPVWGGLAVALSFVPAWKAAQSIVAPPSERDRLQGGIEATLFIHAAGSLLLLGSIMTTLW